MGFGIVHSQKQRQDGRSGRDAAWPTGRTLKDTGVRTLAMLNGKTRLDKMPLPSSQWADSQSAMRPKMTRPVIHNCCGKLCGEGEEIGQEPASGLDCHQIDQKMHKSIIFSLIHIFTNVFSSREC
jgi:hypothetical protein